MTTILFSHPSCLDHDPGPYHPENPARLEAVLGAFEGPGFARLERHEAPRAEDWQLELAHDREHVRRILGAIPPVGRAHLDPDTVVSPGSGEAALRAVGAVTAAVDAVMAGGAGAAFCAVRPPGHHALPRRAMGFCLFNNVAIGALHARRRHGLKRVAVVDFDVHHGNGTQAVFEHDPDLFYASTHQWPLYPGTGALHETGVAGNIVNVPLAPGSGSKEFRGAIRGRVRPALEAFRPELLFISAGFDAHRQDPLAGLNLETEDYGWVTTELTDATRESSGGRVVSALEGGYSLDALAASAAAHVRALIAGSG